MRSRSGEAHRLADEVAVVQDVVVGERRALRQAGGAGGELDVDRIVELQLCRQLRQLFAVPVAAHAEHVVEAEEARRLIAADADQRLQRGQPLRLELARRRAVDLGRKLAQHADIVAALEAGRGDQRPAADLVQRVFELGQAVGGIDVDEDQARLGGGELRDHPFGIVRRPDADALARRKARARSGPPRSASTRCFSSA